jgi:chromosome segregation ATPase
MSQQFEQIERLVDRLGAKISLLQKERNSALSEVASLKSQLQEKDLELIRVKKEMQRTVEQLEREKTALQKELQQQEQRMGDLLGKIRSLLPEDPAGRQ